MSIPLEPLLGIHPKETTLNRKRGLCSNILIAMVFINIRKWKITLMDNMRGTVNYVGILNGS